VSDETRKAIEHALEQINPGRREALKRLLSGAGVLALLPASTIVMSAQEGEGRGKKGDGTKKDLGKKDLGKKVGKKGDGTGRGRGGRAGGGPGPEDEAKKGRGRRGN
jgi:hypothetical protein